MSAAITMMMTLQESEGELVMTLEEAEPSRIRRVLRYPNRLIACQHLQSLNLLPPSVLASLFALDLQDEMLSFPISISDPKITLRGFMPYPMTYWD